MNKHSLLAAVQCDARLGDIETNTQAHIEVVIEASKKGVSFLLFPELSISGYLLQDSLRAKAVTAEELVERFSIQVPHPLTVAVGFPERRADDRFYNSLAVLFVNGDDTKLLEITRKINLATYGMFEEGRYFFSGDRPGFVVLPDGTRVGLLICEDAFHPAVFVALTACHELDVIAVAAASPSRGFHAVFPANVMGWETKLKELSITYGVTALSAHRVGVEDGLIFSGGATAVVPGEVVKRLPLFEEGVLYTDHYSAFPEIRRQKASVLSLQDRELIKTAFQKGETHD